MTTYTTSTSHPTTALHRERVDDHTPLTTETTTVCVVGGGPAGAMLALLLVRQGIHVTVLEAAPDFDRDFRADTIHPVIMEALDDIGLADDLLKQQPHTPLEALQGFVGSQQFALANFSKVRTKFPFITVMPQPRFLEYLVNATKQYEGYQLHMGARVTDLLEENGTVTGVRYRTKEGFHDIKATLVVGADGRFSTIRKLAGFVAEPLYDNLELLWTRLPREVSDPVEGGVVVKVEKGQAIVMFNRLDYWQVGLPIRTGTYHDMKEQPIQYLRDKITSVHPFFADRVHLLESWHDATLLSVATSRVEKWYRPGLLLIGDAAHIMSPIGGVGINVAVQDAIDAANILIEPLHRGTFNVKDLAKVQRTREPITRMMQRIQVIGQKGALGQALAGAETPVVPGWVATLLKIPFIGSIPARIIGWTLFPARVRREYRTAHTRMAAARG